MQKTFKKIRYVMLVLILLMVNFAIPNQEVVEAKTLRQLKQELQDKRAEYEANKHQQQATQAEINEAKSKALEISKEIEQIQVEMVDLTEEIEELNVEIEEKEKEIKEIMNYYQLSSSESAYLEYVFEAADFTDFIYRVAIAEQLSNYNDKLVDEYHEKIEQNEKKKKELDNKTIALSNKQKDLERQIRVYESELQGIVEGAVDIKEDLNRLEKFIETYESYGCSLDQDVESCSYGKLPPGTAFYRPLIAGKVSSNYGYRTYWINGAQKSEFHYGMDFSAAHGTPVYSVADGKVVGFTPKYKCGGNMLYIAHNINGQKYTSAYYHLASVKVKVGDTVTYNTVIGYSGGSPSIETWDKCTTGAHLHLQIATGAYLMDSGYTYYSQFQSRSINPRNIINIPAYGVRFDSRDRKY